MTQRRARKKYLAEINVVPYIDVMLVLLVIFMVTTPLLQKGVEVDLPKASAKKLPPQKVLPMIVTVNSKGQYFLNISKNPNTPLTPFALSTVVRNALVKDSNRQIYVRGDERAEYGLVVQAMVLLQKSGVANVGLMTSDDQGQSKKSS